MILWLSHYLYYIGFMNPFAQETCTLFLHQPEILDHYCRCSLSIFWPLLFFNSFFLPKYITLPNDFSSSYVEVEYGTNCSKGFCSYHVEVENTFLAFLCMASEYLFAIFSLFICQHLKDLINILKCSRSSFWNSNFPRNTMKVLMFLYMLNKILAKMGTERKSWAMHKFLPIRLYGKRDLWLAEYNVALFKYTLITILLQ